MRHQTSKSITFKSVTFKSITFALAVLLALSSWMPLPGRAEAQMRCVGASLHSAPCASAVITTAGLTEQQVYAKLMPCCRSLRAGTMHCSLRHLVQGTAVRGTAAHHSSLSARRCFVTIHVAAAGASAPAAPRTRWFLNGNSALAPPVAAASAFVPASFLCPAFRAYTSTLSPHVLPHLHGLRAPPAA